MLRRVALLVFALTTTSAWSSATAQPTTFAWAGRIDREGAPLLDPDADDESRRAAIAAMRGYDPSLTRRYVLAALDDDDPEVRQQAAAVAGSARMVEAVPRFIAWLSDSDRAVRRTASDTLGEIADATATAALIRTLGDSDGDVRLGAVLALTKIGQRGDRSVVVPLISRVADDKTEVRRAAVEALKLVGDRRAVVAVVGAFADSNLEVRKAAVVAAGKLGDRAAIPALTRTLTDGPPELRNLAVAALGDLGAAEATDDLLVLLVRGGDVAAPAAYALGQIARGDDRGAAGRAVRALVTALATPSLRPVALEALRRAGAAAVPALVAHLDGQIASDPASVIALLGEFGDARATDALIAELDRKRLGLAPIVAALSRTGDPRALIPVLGLLSHADADLRLAAMNGLGNMIAHDDRAADMLIERLGDEREDIQILACRYLGQMSAVQAAPAIAALAGAPRGPGVRRAAIDALGVLGDPSVAPILLESLGDPDPVLARAAADALANLRAPAIADRLATLARAGGPSQAVIVRAWGASRRDRPGRAARTMLIELAETGPTGPALAAIGALAAMGDRDARPALAHLVTDGSPERQRAAAWALGELADAAAPPAVTAALTAALTAKDDRIAGAAAWALVRQRVPEADLALRQLARHGGWAGAINATAALAGAGGPDAIADLTTLLAHASPLVRGNAAWALAQRAATPLPDLAAAALARLLVADPSPWVRAHAARALASRRAEPSYAAALATAARDDKAAAVRDAAAATEPPPVTDDEWRLFDVVEPDDERPVREEAYVVILGARGPAWATFTDRRGVIAAEHVPSDVALPRPATAISDL